MQAERGRYPYRKGNGAQSKKPDKKHPEQTAGMETASERMVAIHVGGSPRKSQQKTIEKKAALEQIEGNEEGVH